MSKNCSAVTCDVRLAPGVPLLQGRTLPPSHLLLTCLTYLLTKVHSNAQSVVTLNLSATMAVIPVRGIVQIFRKLCHFVNLLIAG